MIESIDHTGEIYNEWLVEYTGEYYISGKHKIKKYKYTCIKCGHVKYGTFSKLRIKHKCLACKSKVKIKKEKKIKVVKHHRKIYGTWLLEDTDKKAYKSRNTLYKYTCTKCGYVKYDQYSKVMINTHCCKCNKKEFNKFNKKKLKNNQIKRKYKQNTTRRSKYFMHLNKIAKTLDCTIINCCQLNKKFHILESEEVFYNYLDMHVHFKDGSKFKDLDIPNTKWYNINEACEKLHRSKTTINRLMSEGHISYIDYLQRKVRLLASDIDGLIGKDIRKNHI